MTIPPALSLHVRWLKQQLHACLRRRMQFAVATRLKPISRGHWTTSPPHASMFAPPESCRWPVELQKHITILLYRWLAWFKLCRRIRALDRPTCTGRPSLRPSLFWHCETVRRHRRVSHEILRSSSGGRGTRTTDNGKRRSSRLTGRNQAKSEDDAGAVRFWTTGSTQLGIDSDSDRAGEQRGRASSGAAWDAVSLHSAINFSSSLPSRCRLAIIRAYPDPNVCSKYRWLAGRHVLSGRRLFAAR